jgi:hypothetical protein
MSTDSSYNLVHYLNPFNWITKKDPEPKYTGVVPSSGGRRRKRRSMRGGYSDNIATTGLASTAAKVGGKSQKKRAKRSKRTHRKH